MKNLTLFSIFAFTIIITLLSSCKKEEDDGPSTSSCNGKGTLQLTNKSFNTVQKIMIDGINYGTIDPGEIKKVDLAAGEHEFEHVGISGGSGCSSGKVIIVECETSAFSCKF